MRKVGTKEKKQTKVEIAIISNKEQQKTLMPVSYTHLDVYKRQVINQTISMVKCKFTDRCDTCLLKFKYDR